MTHFRNCGPKLKTSRDFCKYFHSMESKAFSKFRKTARPGMFFALVKDIISDISLILSPTNLPLTYPVWLELIIVGKRAIFSWCPRWNKDFILQETQSTNLFSWRHEWDQCRKNECPCDF